MTKRSREYAKRVKMELAARMRQEASVVEADELRRQAEALRQALEWALEWVAEPVASESEHGSSYPLAIIANKRWHEELEQARAALARFDKETSNGL